jgi:hypothetical protein
MRVPGNRAVMICPWRRWGNMRDAFGWAKLSHHEGRLQHRPMGKAGLAHGFFDVPFVGPVLPIPVARFPSAERQCASGFADRGVHEVSDASLACGIHQCVSVDAARNRCRPHRAFAPKTRHGRPGGRRAMKPGLPCHLLRPRRRGRPGPLRREPRLARQDAYAIPRAQQFPGRGAALCARGTSDENERIGFVHGRVPVCGGSIDGGAFAA